MNKRGFTLIELIVTIALLAIILIISFVSINKVIEQSKINDCESLVGNIKSAANEYVSDNRYKRSFTSQVAENEATTGSKKIILTADDLIAGNYLSSPIINPFDKQEILPMDIKIELFLNDNNYTVNQFSIISPAILTNCKSGD